MFNEIITNPITINFFNAHTTFYETCESEAKIAAFNKLSMAYTELCDEFDKETVEKIEKIADAIIEQRM